MRERGISFKEAFNQAARRGLTGEKRQRNKRFVQKTFSLGQVEDLRWDKTLGIDEVMEDEELTRKLALNK